MRNGEGQHPDIIELRVRLWVEDPDHDIGVEALTASAREIFQDTYLSRLSMFAPETATVLGLGVRAAGPPDDDYTPAPDENLPHN